MENNCLNNTPDNLHTDLKTLIESGLLDPKTIPYLSQLDIDAEQI